MISTKELVNLILGHTGIACETNYDDTSLKNIDKYQELILELVSQLGENLPYLNDYRGSAEAIADKSLEVLKSIKQEIIDYEEDLNV